MIQKVTTHEAWEPEKTRAFIVGLAKFSDDSVTKFSTADRLDGAFAECLRARGVPAEQVVLLQDADATSAGVRKQFSALLRASQPGEHLLFYFGSHGGYSAKTGQYWFTTYDDSLEFTWALDAIEQDFKGATALLLPDACYSGGFAELLPQRQSEVLYASLSSAYAHNSASSSWRFLECICQAYQGNALLDVDQDGGVDLDEVARFAARHMAFVAEGRPTFYATPGFPKRMTVAPVTGKRPSDPQVGQYIEVHWKDQWYKAVIRDVKDGQFFVHYTDYGDSSDAWVAEADVRPFAFTRYWEGAHVELQASSSGKWYPGRVLSAWESLHFCHYDGYGPEYDEWFGPSRIRRVGAGS